ncbi:MAG: cupin domain-containing protein [Myxococcota bacterium]|nr:cupin domain-containing protein [Myxococcota bacterium]
MAQATWRTFELADEIKSQRASSVPYREFLRVPSLSCGIYSLKAGAQDLQGPHDEDEVYYVVSGRARVRVDEQERTLGPGSVLFVPASAEHSFCEIEQDLTLMVFFASGGPSE